MTMLATGMTFSCALPNSFLGSRAVAASRSEPWKVNAFVNIAGSGVITIFSSPAEMGQGSLTSLALVLAEELDADWSQCRVEQSPALGDVYGDPTFLNMIFTVESRSIRVYYDRVRMFGRRARQILMFNAAERWQVPIAKLRTDQSMVIHPDNKQRLSYGEIASFGKFPRSLPELTKADLKQPRDFKLIGKVSERRDVQDKTNGMARYSIDVDLPGMVYAAVTRAPIEGASIKSVTENGAGEMPGVIEVLEKKHQVAVVADSYFQALKAREKIEVVWEAMGAADHYDSAKAIGTNAGIARDLSVAGLPWDKQGDATGQFTAANTVIEREYQSDYMYHGGIEPLNAVVWVKQDGDGAEVWAGTQAPARTIQAVAAETGVATDNIVMHRCPLGGGFGRRSLQSMDFVQDAAWISSKLRRPVKVIWDRQDDIRNGHFRPLSAHLVRAAVDDKGHILGWHHRVACEDPIKRFEPALFKFWNGAPVIGMTGAEHANFDGSVLPFAYDFPHRLVEYVEVKTDVRVYAMRGVGAVANRFAIESFLDEIAARYDLDPLRVRLDLVHRSERAKAVLNTVAEMSEWNKPRRGRGLGISYATHAGGMEACVAEISLDEKSHQIKVHDVWVASDIGRLVQPVNVEAQLVGATIFGLSNALTESVVIKQGRVQQSNFHDYRIMRMNEAPRVHVQVMASEEEPAGVGELGTIAAPSALVNAFANLTGVRLRHMPFTAERVKKALT